jgi:hypothetical protein
MTRRLESETDRQFRGRWKANGMDSSEVSAAGDRAGGGAHDPDASDKLRAAAQTAQYLVELLQDLERDSAAAQMREVERQARDLATFGDIIRQIASGGLDAQDVRTMGELVDALVRKPSDLLVIVKISEQADRLASIIHAHERVLEMVQEAQKPT